MKLHRVIKHNRIYNEDCFKTMHDMKSGSVDLVLTSPPYNMTDRKGGYSDSGRYDVYRDWKDEDEYLDWSIELFKLFNKILKKNKLVLYNFSYSIENPSLPYKLVYMIEKHTDFMLADTIVWRKGTGVPFPANKHRLSRNWEYVFVFCRKDEVDTFDTHRPITKVSPNGQQYYKVFYNLIEAKNNDGKNPYNQATFSSEFVVKLLEIYADSEYVVYDPFMGTGTTAVGVIKFNSTMKYIGSELSKNQCEYAKERLRFS